ncbi:MULTISPECIES: cytochrome c biogenesis CcdA family protein [Nocardioides]|uniref:Cytochrome c-type biogenesis protein n=1 Tax=Nocardioides lianchengensis TaxID=1045774 RepID=A0A1G6TDY4_9ACTN|nr:cytochrome c biogenesis protein CcdA [Nocardioides lianchengensis]NYG11799.1 cytochrome c-type biogenesis protein [Nocardioides lianchengensis]SDD26736.1 cytochrome c-type biogenesis protein [Nocardioides lianchengensis]
MGDWFGQTAGSGSLVLAIPVALLAGLVSFFSPCVIPLLPAYFSYATGLSGADLATGNVKRGRMVAGSTLFVLGFSVVFVLLGVATGSVATWLLVNEDTLNVVLGCFAIAMGLVFIGLVPLLQRDVRFHKVPSVGLAAAPLLGFLFGLGWQPCIGPTLGVIITLGYDEGTAGRSGLLLACYSLGLGIPFILAGLFWQRALGALGFVRRHQQWVTRVGGVMLVLVGLMLVTGWWDYAVTWLQIHLVSDFEVGV